MLLQPAGVTKPSYPGSYDGGWATLHREAKNSSDWAARREWTQTALTGWAAFMVRNDDAAVTSMACVHGWGVASFTAFSRFSLQLSSMPPNTHQQPERYTYMHVGHVWRIFMWLCTHYKHPKTESLSSIIDVGFRSQQLKANCNRNSVVGRLSPAGFLMPVQWSACSCSVIHDIWV